MKKIQTVFLSISLCVFCCNPAQADTESCKVVLCLAAGSMPSECVPPVEAYLAQFADHPWDASSYLATCDMGTSSEVPDTRVIAQAYGHCDANSVNAATQYIVYSAETQVLYHKSTLPQYCRDYAALIEKDGGSLALPHFVPPTPYQRRDPRCTGSSNCSLITVSPPLELGHWAD